MQPDSTWYNTSVQKPFLLPKKTDIAGDAAYSLVHTKNLTLDNLPHKKLKLPVVQQLYTKLKAAPPSILLEVRGKGVASHSTFNGF